MVNATSVASGELTGIERFSLNITRELSSIDTELIVVAAQHLPEIPNQTTSKFLACSNLLLNKREFFSRALWDQTIFRYLVMKHRPDVVFFPIQDGMLFPPVKQVVTVHDLHYLHFEKTIFECRNEIGFLRKKIFQTKMPHILKYSSAVITVSESTKKDIISFFDVSPEKIHVIYNGYDSERFKVIENTKSVLNFYGLNQDKYYLFVGSILKHKNIIRLVQAFSRLDCDFKLVIAGICKDYNYLKDIRQTCFELGVPDNRLCYLEYVSDEDLPYLYNGAIAFVLPSLHEGFGVPIIEAMACGTPVITSNFSSMPEIAGDAALLVDPYSVESIAEAMSEILSNPDRAEELKRAGFERVKSFSWANSAKKLYNLCKKVGLS